MSNQTNRIDTLDYVRGLLALLILFYHFTIWAKLPYNISSPLSRTGLYGVAAFFILSGLTHYMVYQKRMDLSFSGLYDFFVKRFFRIMPMLWLVIALSLLLKPSLFEWKKILLNCTGLFGFVAHNEYIAVGSWSIGNEMVYYLLFPLLLFFDRKSTIVKYILFLVTFLCAVYAGFYLLDEKKSIAVEWKTYIHPLNNLFFFICGFCIVGIKQEFNIKIKNSISFIIVMCLIGLFCFYPAEGNALIILTDTNRILFSTITVLLFFFLYQIEYTLPNVFHIPLKYLAEKSYSIYLLHPVFYMLFSKYNVDLGYKLNIYWVLGTTLVMTIICSNFTFQYIETYGSKMGKWFLPNKK